MRHIVRHTELVAETTRQTDKQTDTGTDADTDTRKQKQLFKACTGGTFFGMLMLLGSFV